MKKANPNIDWKSRKHREKFNITGSRSKKRCAKKQRTTNINEKKKGYHTGRQCDKECKMMTKKLGNAKV